MAGVEQIEPRVVMDDDANFCVIVGTADRQEAEKALRKAEDEWYGPASERKTDEKPLDMEEFSAATIYSGNRKGEEGVIYWGENPSDFFDRDGDGKDCFETEEGFILSLN